MWTADNRPRYNRDKLRYPSDLTDAEWAHIAFHTLTVDDAGRGAGFARGFLAALEVERMMDAIQRPNMRWEAIEPINTMAPTLVD